MLARFLRHNDPDSRFLFPGSPGEVTVVPQTVDSETLDSLKREAVARAEALGHHLQMFRAAKADPLCHVAFCGACRQMVIISLEHAIGPPERGLFGYALEARCAIP